MTLIYLQNHKTKGGEQDESDRFFKGMRRLLPRDLRRRTAARAPLRRHRRNERQNLYLHEQPESLL